MWSILFHSILVILVDSLTVDISEYNQFYKTMTTGDEINDDLPTIAEDLVVTKYKMAAEIVNSKLLKTFLAGSWFSTILLSEVLKEMIGECKPGSSIRDLCILGDKKLVEETGKAYKKDKKLVKGKLKLTFFVL